MIGITMIGKLTKFASSELERQNAVVSDERTEVSGGENASTSYFVTLEFPGGRREEFPTEGRVVGKVRPGDVGIAYLRGGILLDFKRVSV